MLNKADRTSSVAFHPPTSGSASFPRSLEMKSSGRVYMMNSYQEPEKKGVENGPSAPIKTSSSAVSSAGKVIVPLEMSLEQIGAIASQVLFSPSAGSSTSFCFPDPMGSEASPFAKKGASHHIFPPQVFAQTPNGCRDISRKLRQHGLSS